MEKIEKDVAKIQKNIKKNSIKISKLTQTNTILNKTLVMLNKQLDDFKNMKIMAKEFDENNKELENLKSILVENLNEETKLISKTIKKDLLSIQNIK